MPGWPEIRGDNNVWPYTVDELALINLGAKKQLETKQEKSKGDKK